MRVTDFAVHMQGEAHHANPMEAGARRSGEKSPPLPGGDGGGSNNPSSCYWLFHLRSCAYSTSGTHGTHSAASVIADFTLPKLISGVIAITQAVFDWLQAAATVTRLLMRYLFSLASKWLGFLTKIVFFWWPTAMLMVMHTWLAQASVSS